jgi:branched-chain amino acid transport system ATP-binding protein
MWRHPDVATPDGTSALAEFADGLGASSTDPILSTRDVAVRFGGVTALSGITVDVVPREIMAVVGPNGAGKTTLLNAICGLIRKNTTGDIRVAGHPILGSSPSSIAKTGIGRSFQDPPLIDHATVLENVLSGAHLTLKYGMASQLWRRRYVRRSEEAAKVRAMTVLEFAGLADRAEQRVAGLPYGTRKLIDITRAMMSGHSLLFLDEPTSGLDSGEQAVVAGILDQIRSERRLTVLMVEHHMDLVRKTADRVIGLQAGTVLVVGTPNEVLDSEQFRIAVIGNSASVKERDVTVTEIQG